MWHRILTFGAEGTEAGNFCRPWGVAIARYSDLSTFAMSNSNNNGISYMHAPVWSFLIGIADRSNNRIQLFKFDAIRQTVTFLHMFGEGPGARHGQFDRPAGLVFNPKLEQIIVADKDNHRVQVFDMTGSYLFKFGERGNKCGQFCYPWDIDVCKATHNVVVSDTRNRRIQMFNNLGRYITHFNQPLDSPRGVAYLSPLQLMVSDFNKHRLLLITQNLDDKLVSSSTSAITSNEFDYLSNNFHQAFNNNNNNLPQKVASRLINHQQSQLQQLHESKFVGFGEGSSWGEFLRPQGVTTNGSSVYCADSRNNRVACWNKETQTFSYISRDVVELDRPAGLAATDNYLVIVDFGNNRVHICQRSLPMNGFSLDTPVQSRLESCNWRRILTFGSEGTEAGNFCRPWGAAIAKYSDLSTFTMANSNNNYMHAPLWSFLIGIADRSNNRIQLFKFDAIRQTVTFLHMFGEGPGARHGQFDRPAGLVFNPKLEQIIVADKDNHRVQVFDMTGSYLFKFGERGNKCGQFCYPWDIDVCKATHNVVVSDTRNRRIQIFNNLGSYITHFNQPLDSPRGVAYLSPTQMVVSDFNKHRLLMITQNLDDKIVSSSTSAIISNEIDYLSNNFHQTFNNNLPQKATPRLSNHQQLQPQLLHESKFVGFGEGSSWGEFLRPQGVTSDGSSVYCADSRNNRVACWNKETQTFSYIDREVVELDRPAGLAAIDNYLVIVDFGNNRVHICQRSRPINGFSFDTPETEGK